MTYRADIDGLRAIAVVSVLLFHYGFGGAPGGFIGVDVFFVISGFLITSILFRDIEDGRFSLLSFYDRRIRRILPALLAMLAVTGLVGYALIFPGQDYASLAESGIFAAFGSSNFYFYSHTGYFDQSAEFLPLLHTWSLGVEEQFYLVWPALLAAIAFTFRRSRRAVAISIGVLIAVSFAASLHLIASDPKAAFYFPHVRAWELAEGALLIFLRPLRSKVGEAANLVGLAMIAIGIAIIANDETFPGWSALLPCCGSALVIWPKAQTVTARALGRLRGLGLISYSLYLWHWPVWVFYRIYINDGVPTAMEGMVLVLFAVGISYLSFRFIESPFRRLRRRHLVVVGSGLLASGILAALLLSIVRHDGFSSRIPARYLTMRSLEEMWKWDCEVVAVASTIPQECVFGAKWSTAKTKGVLWGDSHSGHFAPLLEPLAKDAGASIVLYQTCAALVDGDKVSQYFKHLPQYSRECGVQRAAMLQTLRDHDDINLVILASAWSYLPSLLYRVDANDRGGPLGFQLFEQSLEGIVAALERLGKRIVVIGTVPQWQVDPVPCELAPASLFRASCTPPKLPRKVALGFQATTYDIISRVTARHRNAMAILPALSMCEDSACIDTMNGEMLYRDGGHIRRNLTEETRRQVAKIIGLDRIFSDVAGRTVAAAGMSMNR